MFDNPSLITRIAIGKLVGFLVGILGFIALPYFLPDAEWHYRWGILVWYATVGAFIGVFGVFTWHPILKLPMPWWVRAPIIGAWMNFVLTLFAYDFMARFMLAVFGPNGLMTSPFWFVLEGAVVGFAIGFLATRFGGEGNRLLEFENSGRNAAV